MIPVSLKLENFCSYGTEVPELKFDNFRLACLSGNNGVGKSSLLDSITWVLWGWSRTGDNADRLVRQGTKQMAVEFAFELEGTVYKVKRTRKLGSNGQTTLELLTLAKEDWMNLTEGTIKTTQEKINAILHLTYETFINSAYLRQGRADEFTLKRPNERKEILANILGLDQYDQWEEKAKEKVREIATQVSSLEYSLNEIETELAQKELFQSSFKEAQIKVLETQENKKKVAKEKESLHKRKEELLIVDQNYQQLKKALEEAKKELDEIVSQGKARSLRIQELEVKISKGGVIEKEMAKLEELEKSDKALNEKQTYVLQLTNQKSSLISKVAAKKKEQKLLEVGIEKLQQKINLVEVNDKCPTCGASFEGDHKQQALDEINQEILQKQKTIEGLSSLEEKELAEIEKKITSINYSSSEHQEIKGEINSLQGAKKEKELLNVNRATLEAEKRTTEELRVLFGKKKKQVDALQLSLDKTPQVSLELQATNLKLTQLEIELADLEKLDNEARDRFGQAKKLIERLKLLERSKEAKTKQKSQFSEEKVIYEELALAFSKKGIQAMLIESAIPEIEEEANLILDRLTDGNMKVSFETQRENKSGGIVETLDIVISDETGPRPYETYSGGEAFRVNFAIRLAISKLLTHRSGSKLQFLIIDEGFGTQDAQGRDRLIEAINLIRDDFAKVLVITHLEDLKAAFGTRIEVSKGSNGSTFKVIGA